MRAFTTLCDEDATTATAVIRAALHGRGQRAVIAAGEDEALSALSIEAILHRMAAGGTAREDG